jgi:D-lactate dehydrogenase
MKDGVMVINTGRGGLIDSNAAIEALKKQKVGALGMDVYENERELFFEDKSNDVIQDDVFAVYLPAITFYSLVIKLF